MSDEDTGEAPDTAETPVTHGATAQAVAKEIGRKVTYGGRTGLSVILAILAVIGLVASTAAFWARSTIYEEDQWVQTIRALPRDHDVAVAISGYLTEQLFLAVDFEGRVEDALPNDVAVIVPILTNAIEGFVAERAAEFIESDEFEQLWVTANRQAHRVLMAILDDHSTIPGLERNDDTITLNLIPAINALLDQIGDTAGGVVGTDLSLPDLEDADTQQTIREMSDRLGVDLPDDFGQITVYQGDKLPQARDTVVLVERIRFATAVLTVVLAVAALWVSPSRRRMTVGLLIGSAAGFALLLTVPNEIGAAISDLLAAETDQLAARHAVGIVFESYVSLYRWMLFTAVFSALMILVTGPSRIATWIRGEVRRQVGRFDWSARAGEILRRKLRWFRFGGPIFMFFLLLVVARGTLTSLFLFFAFVTAWESLLSLVPGHPRAVATPGDQA